MLTTPATQEVIGDRYVLESLLGEGGMARVYEARHTLLGSKVAIKFLRPGRSKSDRAETRFLQEAQVMAQISARNVVRVFDYGIHQGLPYLVMEHVDGETLEERLAREKRLSPTAAVKLLTQAARGLERAHGHGVIHRDFKPANVLLTLGDEGELEAKVLDFGVARLFSSLDVDSVAGLPSASSARLTPETGIVGTPYYMAPEQLRGDGPGDVPADVWSFGVVAFECLVGQRPFEGGSVTSLYRRILRGEHRTARELLPTLPRAFDAWFERACAALPEARFQTIRAAADALSDCFMQAPSLPPPRDSRVPVALVSLGAGLVIGAAGLALLEVAHDRAPRAAVSAGTPQPPAPVRVAAQPDASCPAPPRAAGASVDRPASFVRPFSTARAKGDEVPPSFKADPYGE